MAGPGIVPNELAGTLAAAHVNIRARFTNSLRPISIEYLIDLLLIACKVQV
jgi:hypothetical protein